MINKVKIFLSGRKITIAILFVVILGRIIQLVYFYNIVVDASFQVMATQNLLSGHGISISNVLPGDLSTPVYTPLIKWPPGYSLLLAPFYFLFNGNYIAAGLTLDIISAITLIFISRRILRIIETPLYLINIYTFLTSFFIYYFYYNPSSDAIAIAILMIALYFTLRLLKKNSDLVKNTVGLTIFLFACASIKYLFMPAVFVIPVFLIIKGFSDNNTAIKKAGIWSLLFLAFGIGAILAYQKIISGSSTYISATGRGFFPENLLAAYPTFPASFIKPDTLSLLLNNAAVPGILIKYMYQVIYVLALLFVLIGFGRLLIKRGFKNLSVTVSFFYLSFFLSLSIILLLATLSLFIVKEEIFPWQLWTYVEDGRYYGLPNVLMHLGVFVGLAHFSKKYYPFLRYSFYFLILLMIPDTLRGINFDINRVMKFRKEEYSWQYEDRFQKYAAQIIKNELLKRPADNVAVTGSFYYLNHRVSLYNHIPILNETDQINNLPVLNTKKPALLLVILHEDTFPGFQPFLSIKGKEVAGYFNRFYFYTVYINPH